MKITEYKSCFINNVKIISSDDLNIAELTDINNKKYSIDISNENNNFKQWFNDYFLKNKSQLLTIFQYTTNNKIIKIII